MADRQDSPRPPYWVPRLDLFKAVIAALALIPVLLAPRCMGPQLAAPTLTTAINPIKASRPGYCLTGTGPANSTVTLYKDGQPWAKTQADGNGNWKYVLPGLLPGVYAMTVGTSDNGVGVFSPKFDLIVEGASTAGAAAAPTTQPTKVAAVATVPAKAPAAAPAATATAVPATAKPAPTATTIATKPVIAPVIAATGGILALDPAKGGTVGGTSAPNAKVDVLVDGKSVGTATADAKGNWRFELPATPDGAVVSVKTADGVSNDVKVSAPVLPAITLPSGGLAIDPTTGGPVTGTGVPGEMVEVFVDGKSVGTTVVDADGKWSFELPGQPSGKHTVSAKGTNGTSQEVDFTVPELKVPAITPPSGGLSIDLIKGIEVPGVGVPGETVEVFVDGKSVGTTVVDSDGKWSFELPTLPSGKHAVGAKNTNGTSQEVDFTVPELVAPAIGAPTANSTVDTAKPGTLSGTALPGETVEIFVDGRSVGTALADADGKWSFELPAMRAGNHDITVKGVGGTSTAVRVAAVVVKPPVIAVPSGGINIESGKGGVVNGTSTANADVEVIIDGKVVGTAKADARGNWKTTIPGQPTGDYVIKAKTSDGTSNEVPVSFKDKIILLPTTGGGE